MLLIMDYRLFDDVPCIHVGSIIVHELLPWFISLEVTSSGNFLFQIEVRVVS
jgi:hypothetical protein